mgnify:FL=1
MSDRVVISSLEMQHKRLLKSAKAGDYDAVVQTLRRTEEVRHLDVPELLLKGRSIQLMSAEAPNFLSEAEAAFLEVLDRDPDNADACVELGWYYDAVEDDPARALPFFERAQRILAQRISEAESGVTQFKEQLSRKR